MNDSVAGLVDRDDDNDSISNGIELAHGLNPFVANQNESVGEIDFTQNPPVFRFEAAISHLTYEVQSSTTLENGSWVTRSTVGQTGTIETTIGPSWEADDRVFMRVLVSGFY